MACEVHLLCAILKTHKQVSMILMMVCPKSGFHDSSVHLISNLDSTVITLADWCALFHLAAMLYRLTSQSGTTTSPLMHPVSRPSIVRSLTTRVVGLVDLLRCFLLSMSNRARGELHLPYKQLCEFMTCAVLGTASALFLFPAIQIGYSLSTTT
jgi:hypothetical protein